MAVSVRIRPLRQGELPRLHEIRAAAFAPVFASFRAIVGGDIAAVAFAAAEKEQADHLDQICDPASSTRVLVAAIAGRAVGFVAVSLDKTTRIGEIGLNAVDPDHVNAGIGTRLYEAALDVMRQAGMQVATVGTGGDDSHAPARRAYEKAGFCCGVPSVHLYRKL